METAVGVFGIPSPAFERPATASILMAAQESTYNLQSASRGFLKCGEVPPVIAHEDCRERMGNAMMSIRPASNDTRYDPAVFRRWCYAEQEKKTDRCTASVPGN